MAFPLAALLVIGLAEPPMPRPEVKNPQLRDELQTRVKKDQDARFKLIEAMSGGMKVSAADGTAMTAIDKENRDWLKSVVEKHGWPGKTLVGKDGAHDAWLLLQHADADLAFQKTCLELFKAAVKAGEAEGQDLAYLTDRVLVNEKKMQIYGTQLVQKEGRFEPQPIEDEANVDKRRKELGMPPLAEYIKLAEGVYKVKKPKSDEGKKP
jgi:hypothetical protein